MMFQIDVKGMRFPGTRRVGTGDIIYSPLQSIALSLSVVGEADVQEVGQAKQTLCGKGVSIIYGLPCSTNRMSVGHGFMNVQDRL